jgi:hypothetical protein
MSEVAKYKWDYSSHAWCSPHTRWESLGEQEKYRVEEWKVNERLGAQAEGEDGEKW